MSIMALALTGCMGMSPQSMQDFFPVFFAANTAELPMDAQGIVRQAAANAKALKASRIEVAVPPDSGGRTLTEGRFTAIQNLLSAAGVNPNLLARSTLSADAAKLPGAADRAEIKLVHAK
jgi:hypothetical protein